MFEIFRVDDEALSSEDVSPFAVAKVFLGFREKYCEESLSDEVKILFDFSLIFFRRGFNDILEERRCGEIICEGSVLSARHDERFKINTEIRFFDVTFMKGVFEICNY